MVKINFLIVLFFICHCSYSQENFEFFVEYTGDRIENEYAISDSLKSNLPQGKVLKIEKAFPASRKNELANIYIFSCHGNKESMLQEINLNRIKHLRGAIELPEIELLWQPNDFSDNNLTNYALTLINANQAWDLTLGDTSITIAILDTNFELTHEELIGKSSFVDSTNTNSMYTHGTAVSIVAAGNTNNNIGTSSIGYNSKLQFRAMNYNQILEASYSGASVINLSWSSGCFYNQYCQNVIDEATENGSIIVAAAGNGNTCGGPENLVYPASFNNVISVSSVGPLNNHERVVGDISTTHQHNDSVDICAPGYDVLVSPMNGLYLSGNGTSFAAPMVSGTIALMLAVNPCLNYNDILSILDSSSLNLDSINPQYAGKLGFGRIDAALAVQLASNYNKLPFESSVYYDCSDALRKIKIVSDPLQSYQVIWSNGTVGSILENVLIDSTYSGILQDNFGCYSKFNVLVDAVGPLSISSTIQDNSCAGDSNAFIDLQVNGGNGNHTILWSINESGNSITNLAAGTYTVQIVDELNCSLNEQFTIEDPQNIELVLTLAHSDIKNHLKLCSTVTGGTPPYSYEWNTGDDSSSIDAQHGQFYELQVIDQNNCYANSNIEIANNYFIIDFTQYFESGLLEVESDSIKLFPTLIVRDKLLNYEGPEIVNYQFYDSKGADVTNSLMFTNSSFLILNELNPGFYKLVLIDDLGIKREFEIVVSL